MWQCQTNVLISFCFYLLFSAVKAKIEFNKRLTLIPTESWIQCASFLDLCYSPRSIIVKIDPTGLPPGVHTGKYVNYFQNLFRSVHMNLFSFFFIRRIRAYECSDVDKGSVFEIPVTVVQPIVLDSQSNWRHEFDEVVCKPNTILRHFIAVPNNATWAGKYIQFISFVQSK